MKAIWLAAIGLGLAISAHAQPPNDTVNAPQAAPRLPPMPPGAMVISRRPELTRASQRKLQGLTSAAAAAGERGVVTLALCIGADGSVSDPAIAESSGYPRLDRMTLDMMDDVKFTPALDRDGKPVAICEPPYIFRWVWEE